MRITTAVTQLLGIDLPILAGGTAQAALAVSTAGGLGVIEAGHMDPDELGAAAGQVQAGTTRPFAVSIPLDATGGRLGPVLAKFAQVVVTSGAGPRPSRIRPGTVWLHAVGSLKEALGAAGVDGLVVIGETGAASLPFGLVRDVARALPGVPLVAMGGTDGADLLTALALGAGAVWFREPIEESFIDMARRVAGECETAVGRLPLPAAAPPAHASGRAAREAAALRENLVKRKNQARARSGQP